MNSQSLTETANSRLPADPGELIDVVYDELRRVASRYLRHERTNHTLQPTALVHEAYLRLIEQENTVWQSREHFIGVAATMMRRILVNYAIQRKRLKRGGGDLRVFFTETSGFVAGRDLSLVDLDEALTKMSREHPNESEIVELKFFGGLSIAEAAQLLNVSDTTVERRWRFARAWLLRELKDE